jgi:hypothetical protein
MLSRDAHRSMKHPIFFPISWKITMIALVSFSWIVKLQSISFFRLHVSKEEKIARNKIWAVEWM